MQACQASLVALVCLLLPPTKKEQMKGNDFLKKTTNGKLWLHLGAMALFIVLMFLGLKWLMDVYTNHGKVVVVPNIVQKDFSEAEAIAEGLDLRIEVQDTGYVKTLPPNSILTQSIAAGERVKPGRTIFITINASSTPTMMLPDVIDNSSYREARMRLIAMGFKVGEPQYIPGEKDWVYGITGKNGRQLSTGSKVSIEEVLIIQVGDGRLNAADSLNYVDTYAESPSFETEDVGSSTENGEQDDFEVVTGPEPEKPSAGNGPSITNKP